MVLLSIFEPFQGNRLNQIPGIGAKKLLAGVAVDDMPAVVLLRITPLNRQPQQQVENGGRTSPFAW
jgi:hypothetical protein